MRKFLRRNREIEKIAVDYDVLRSEVAMGMLIR